MNYRNKLYHYLIATGLIRKIEPPSLVLGEVAFTTDTHELKVGDGKGGAVTVAHVIEGPHDKNLYAKLGENDLLTPLGIRR